jgi:hypothetical protein
LLLSTILNLPFVSLFYRISEVIVFLWTSIEFF